MVSRVWRSPGTPFSSRGLVPSKAVRSVLVHKTHTAAILDGRCELDGYNMLVVAASDQDLGVQGLEQSLHHPGKDASCQDSAVLAPPHTHTHPDETSLPRAWVGEESDRVLRDVCCVVLGDVKSYISCAKEQNCIG